MIQGTGIRSGLIALAFALCSAAGPVQAQPQNPNDWQRVMTRDAVLVSQAIGWSLEGPLNAGQAAPVVFAPGTMPTPIAAAGMSTHRVMLTDYATAPSQANRRGLTGAIELADGAEHRVLAQFGASYEIAGGVYRVDTLTVKEIHPDTPRVEAYVVPAATAASLTGQSPFAMLATLRRIAIEPTHIDSAPRAYQVFVVGMDRLSSQADLGFAAVDAATGREIVRSRSLRQNGWVVASMPLTVAWNGGSGVYFPVYYQPDGAAGSRRIVEMFSNRYGGGAPAAAPAGAQAAAGPAPAPAPLPPSPTLSPVGQGFMTKSYPNQVGRP